MRIFNDLDDQTRHGKQTRIETGEAANDIPADFVRLGDVDLLADWLAADLTITTHDLYCLLAKLERSFELSGAARRPISIRNVYARRIVKTALRRRMG